MPLTKAEREKRRWLRVRRRARARLVQALYAWEAAGSSSLVRSAQLTWDDMSLGADERAFAEPLLRRMSEGMPAIDGEIAAVTTNWRTERIGKIERAILRLAA
ncbi:MAG: transcription antitermination factor NusB, partial [Gemmatimonadaceae bacterium]